MSSATVVHLKTTNHVVSAFTRKGTDETELSEQTIQRLFEKGLTLRLLPQSPLKPKNWDGTNHVNVPDSPPVSPNRPRSRHEVKIEVSELATAGEALKTPLQDFVRLPTDFSANDGKIEAISRAPTAFTLHAQMGLAYSLRSDGLDLRITPTTQTSITKELNVSVIYRHENDKLFFLHSSNFGTAGEGVPVSAKVTFPTKSGQSPHFILLMIDQFRLIWDELPIEDDLTVWTRIWVP